MEKKSPHAFLLRDPNLWRVKNGRERIEISEKYYQNDC